ncbi:type I polyketide synthase [Streptomyces himalayensis]|uniref:SDR family NAD(P)-dependent oxidoreductase n=1 Tax=Streptomyces himalayensis subsp. himalayensis TaxID=2756131 RepID=A0A7W0IDY3_9ACTN|nr:type I polyketide synthase [Streptomyces himalayensis]MBA2951797.1 SDR family NAD(P)-dependent oxidoreductase [Streptomyces himalayensis subsp. himalayensis]
MSASMETPIAVVGIGCRFPGGVESPGGLWRLVAEGRSTVGPVPANRWDAARLASLHDPDLAARAGRGCFLEGDVWAWDPEAFSVAPAEQRWVDPQFRVLAEVAWEAVEHAGIPVDALRGSRTGVFMGTYAPDNLFREARPVQDAPNSPYLFGNFTAGAAGRVAFAMDLRGPVMVVSTHCSSGLVALDSACGALTLGECDAALAGAVLLMLSPETHFYEAPLLLSQRGACHAFDSRADGYVRGEGAGVLMLKRLADARRDGDRVLAVIRGSSVNNDGQASRLTAPSTVMQQQLFRRTVEQAGIDPGEVGLVEAHGPGTAVGDPIEYTSINAIYGKGRGRCALGSIKTNIGHSEPVSGIAGVIKSVECLRRGQIPQNLNFRTWNPAINREEKSRLFVPTELTSWPVPGPSRLAAVCSYGVTGTNAHVILEAAPIVPRHRAPRSQRASEDAGRRLFLLSGHSPQALTEGAFRLAAWLEADGAGAVLGDVAHTLAVRRGHADHRLGIVARDRRELAARARAFAAQEPVEGVVSGVPRLSPGHAGPVFVFTGQGSQRPGMCRQLLAAEPVFTAVIDELDPLIEAEAGFSLREVIEHPQRLRGLERIQPALFGVQVALAALWRSWGVEPSAVIGQSLGEVAAMVVAEGLSPADGVKVICRRSALLATISGGAMASVMLGAAEVAATIEEAGADGVSLGVLTSPSITVISGDAAQVNALVERWEGQGVVARLIDVEVASHSSQVDPVLDRLRTALADVPEARPRIPFYSTVSADPAAPGPVDGAYWVRNQRDPVRFHAAVSAALTAGHRLFIECTAHPLAVRPILDTARHDSTRDVIAVGTLRQGTDDQETFLTHLAAVHTAGYDGIDFHARYGQGELVDVPVTAWHRTRHGGDQPPYQLVAPSLPGARQHPLLGGHVHDPEHPERHLWQTPVGPNRLPWLGDHRVADVPVLPGTGFVEMMLAAAGQVFATTAVTAREVEVLHPLVLDPEPQVTTRLVRADGTARVEILSRSGTEVTVHARGTVLPRGDGPRSPALTHDQLGLDDWQDSEPTELHRVFRERHNVHHGPAFTAIDRIRVHPTRDAARAWLRIHDTARVSAWAMTLHPALADQVVQSAVAAWLAHYRLTPGPVVVAGFDEVTVCGTTAHTRLVAIDVHQADDLGCTASGRLATADGTVVAEIRGLQVRNITPPVQRFGVRLTRLCWEPLPAATPRRRCTTTPWTVLTADDSAWPADLALELDRQTAGCRLSPLTAALGQPDALDGTSGVVLAAGDGNADDMAAAAHELTSGAVTLIQHLAALERPPRLWVVAREGTSPGAAALRGLLRVAAYEHPELAASHLEFTTAVPYEQVLDELLDPDQPITEIRLRPDGRHIARVVPGPATAIDFPPVPDTPVRPGTAYLVTGGLGGLGLLTVDWLAGRGAARVVANGRSTPSPTLQAHLDALRRAGTDISVVQGDIADPAVARETVAAATRGGLALRGVLHAAGVVEDATLANLDHELLERVWRGKADGAWALHHATAGLELDFFVLYSSVAALIGSPGQGAYAAANAFLDALATHRRERGLVATSIQWGAWSQVGRGQHLGDRGFATITPADGIDALERILAADCHQTAYSPLDVDQWTSPYPGVRDSTLLTGLLTADVGRPQEGSAIRDQLVGADSLPHRREILESFIIATVRDLLGGTTRHIGPHTSLVLLGLDSLGAIQLQQRLQRALRTEMKPGVIWVKPSAAALADWLLEHIGLGHKE